MTDAEHDYALLLEAATGAVLGERPSRDVFAHAVAFIEHYEAYSRFDFGHTRRRRTLEEIERVPEWDRAKVARRPKRK